MASWLADVLLYDLDRELSQMNGYYVRYSDDMLFIGKDYEKAMDTLQKRLEDKSNEAKSQESGIPGSRCLVQVLRIQYQGRHGLALVITHQDLPARDRAADNPLPGHDTGKAVDAVNRYLYKGEFSWAIQVLPVCNVKSDLNELNKVR